LPRGVTVALQILDLFVMVRIHARQPDQGAGVQSYLPYSTLNAF